jgi:DNA-binding MarR family transcriptional regulator
MDNNDNIKQMLNNNRFTRIAIFADVVNRFIDIEMKDNVNWLKTFCLIILISRGDNLTITELGRIMLRSHHSMTILVDKMAREGLIRRRRAEKDRRIVQLKVTQKGFDHMMKTLNEIGIAEKEMESCLDEAELKTLIALTKKLRIQLIDRISNKV